MRLQILYCWKNLNLHEYLAASGVFLFPPIIITKIFIFIFTSSLSMIWDESSGLEKG